MLRRENMEGSCVAEEGTKDTVEGRLRRKHLMQRMEHKC